MYDNINSKKQCIQDKNDRKYTNTDKSKIYIKIINIYIYILDKNNRKYIKAKYMFDRKKK